MPEPRRRGRAPELRRAQVLQQQLVQALPLVRVLQRQPAQATQPVRAPLQQQARAPQVCRPGQRKWPPRLEPQARHLLKVSGLRRLKRTRWRRRSPAAPVAR